MVTPRASTTRLSPGTRLLLLPMCVGVHFAGCAAVGMPTWPAACRACIIAGWQEHTFYDVQTVHQYVVFVFGCRPSCVPAHWPAPTTPPTTPSSRMTPCSALRPTQWTRSEWLGTVYARLCSLLHMHVNWFRRGCAQSAHTHHARSGGVIVGGDYPEAGASVTGVCPAGGRRRTCACTYPARATQLDRDGVAADVGAPAAAVFYTVVPALPEQPVTIYAVRAAPSAAASSPASLSPECLSHVL